jgi:hypothetical protein
MTSYATVRERNLFERDNAAMSKRDALVNRFEVKYIPEPNSGCWLWTAALNHAGYGKIGIGSRHEGPELAHRVSWKLYRGEIPKGLTLDHLCRVRCCVNPDHLEPVTIRVNSHRGNTLTGINSRKTHCPRGHPYDRVLKGGPQKGRRSCVVCHLAACKRFNQLKRDRSRARPF